MGRRGQSIQWFNGLPDERLFWDDCAECEPEEKVEIWWDEMDMALPDVSLRLGKDEGVRRILRKLSLES